MHDEQDLIAEQPMVPRPRIVLSGFPDDLPPGEYEVQAAVRNGPDDEVPVIVLSPVHATMEPGWLLGHADDGSEVRHSEPPPVGPPVDPNQLITPAPHLAYDKVPEGETTDFLVTMLVHAPRRAWLRDYGPPLDEHAMEDFLTNGLYPAGSHMLAEVVSVFSVQGMTVVRPAGSAARSRQIAP